MFILDVEIFEIFCIPGVEPGLVMHQYQCNGVLAGIAICR